MLKYIKPGHTGLLMTNATQNQIAQIMRELHGFVYLPQELERQGFVVVERDIEDCDYIDAIPLRDIEYSEDYRARSVTPDKTGKYKWHKVKKSPNHDDAVQHYFWLRKPGAGAVIVGIDGWDRSCEELLNDITENTDWEYSEMEK